MKKILMFLSIFVIFYISIANSEVNKIDEKVLEEIQEEDNVRVIIKLEEKTSYQKILNVDTKQQVIDSLNNKVKHEFDDGVSAIISEEDLIDLENNPNVRSIELVGINRFFCKILFPWLMQLQHGT